MEGGKGWLYGSQRKESTMTLAGDREREASDRVSALTTIAHTAVVVLLGFAFTVVVLSLYVPFFVSR